MVIELKKFGTMLISRQAGREALAAFTTARRDIAPAESLYLDFQGVLTFSPSWGDEFLTPLQSRFGERLILQAADNPSVKATLEILAKTNGKKWNIVTT